MGSCIKAQPRPPQPTTPFRTSITINSAAQQPSASHWTASATSRAPPRRRHTQHTGSADSAVSIDVAQTFQAAKSTSDPLATLQKKVRYLPGRPLLPPSPIQVRWSYLQTHRLDYMQSVCSCGLATSVAQEPSSPFSLPCSRRSPQSCKGSSPSRRLNSPKNASSHRRTKIPK